MTPTNAKRDPGLRVAHVRLKNVLGIEELEFTPGNVTVIRGGNAKGKSSIITVLREAFKGGKDATLLRQGASEGQIVLDLEGEGLPDYIHVEKTVTAEDTKLKVVDPIAGRIGAPQAFLNNLLTPRHQAKLAEMTSVNPVRFLTADDAHRVTYFLEALPFELDFGRLAAITGEGEETLRKWYGQMHPLVALETLRKKNYDSRTDCNREIKAKRETAKTMAASLPTVDPNVYAQLEQAQREQNMLREETSEKVKDVKAAIRKDLEDLQHEREVGRARIRHDYEVELDRLRKEYERACEAVRIDSDDELARFITENDLAQKGVRDAEASTLRSLQAEFEPKDNDLTDKISGLLAQHDAITKAEEGHKYVSDLTRDAETLQAMADTLTDKIAALDELKADLLRQTPLRGVEVRDGNLFVDGVSWNRMNDARKVRLAIEVARLKAGPLGLVCVDNLETLDDPTFRLFCREADQAGLQFIVTRVHSLTCPQCKGAGVDPSAKISKMCPDCGGLGTVPAPLTVETFEEDSQGGGHAAHSRRR